MLVLGDRLFRLMGIVHRIHQLSRCLRLVGLIVQTTNSWRRSVALFHPPHPSSSLCNLFPLFFPSPCPLHLERITDDQVLSAMSQFQGEANIRLRFTEYIKRFTSLASYQEYSHTGRTKIGFPPITFRNGQLGTGPVFTDDMARQREMRSNGHKIDAWRKTDSYKLYVKVSFHYLLIPISRRWLMCRTGKRN